MGSTCALAVPHWWDSGCRRCPLVNSPLHGSRVACRAPQHAARPRRSPEACAVQWREGSRAARERARFAGALRSARRHTPAAEGRGLRTVGAGPGGQHVRARLRACTSVPGGWGRHRGTAGALRCARASHLPASITTRLARATPAPRARLNHLPGQQRDFAARACVRRPRLILCLAQGRKAALVRQISNPMAGMDTTLLALAGCGYSRRNSAFGFMSCDRTIGAAEGCNVLQERRVRQGAPGSCEDTAPRHARPVARGGVWRVPETHVPRRACHLLLPDARRRPDHVRVRLHQH